jgi:hypothetical protein
MLCDSGHPVTVKHRILVDYEGREGTILIGDKLFLDIKRFTAEAKRETVKTRIVHGQTLTIAQQRKKHYVDHRNKILGLH